MNKKLLGKRFREIRKNLGYTQEQFAEIAGIEPQSISKIESGKNFPLLSNLEKIADRLGIDLSEFFIFKKLILNSKICFQLRHRVQNV